MSDLAEAFPLQQVDQQRVALLGRLGALKDMGLWLKATQNRLDREGRDELDPDVLAENWIALHKWLHQAVHEIRQEAALMNGHAPP